MKRIISLDIYKSLAAVMVILIHVTATPIVTLTAGPIASVLIAVNRFANPSVPMFVFASGLSLFYIYGGRGVTFREFIGKRLPKILIPYLGWCVVYYAYYVYAGIYALSATVFIQNVLTGRVIYHLYFVVIIIQFYLVFGIIHYAVNKFSGKIILPLGLLINILAASLLPASYSDRSVLTYLIYFLLGCYVAKHLKTATEGFRRYGILISLSFFILGGIYAYQFYEAQFLNISSRFIPAVYAYIGFCAVALLFYYLVSDVLERTTREGGALRKGLLALSDGSYYIYLSHPLAIIAAGSLSARLGMTGVLDQMGIAFILVWLTAVPLSILYARRKSWRKMKRAAEESKSG
jgi:surface polysaccharide O-acyltransferase-like enzyme